MQKSRKEIANVAIELNEDFDVFVWEKDSSENTILEALSIVTTSRMNGLSFEKQIKARMHLYKFL